MHTALLQSEPVGGESAADLEVLCSRVAVDGNEESFAGEIVDSPRGKAAAVAGGVARALRAFEEARSFWRNKANLDEENQ
jgi:hypothetical protein